MDGQQRPGVVDHVGQGSGGRVLQRQGLVMAQLAVAPSHRAWRPNAALKGRATAVRAPSWQHMAWNFSI